MTSRIYRSIIIVFGLWLLAWLYLSWPATQDDAFIHLRYAVNLLQHHMISYDGVHPDYGTSSLLYVWLLAGLRIFFTSPVLPRTVSTVFHLLLFGGLVWAFARPLRSAPKLAWGCALFLLALLVAPMAVRWLDDGMETSLSLCLVALIAFSISHLCHSVTVSRRSVVWLVILGFVATLTRVEYLLLLCIASLTLYFARLSLPIEAAARRRLSARLRLAVCCGAPFFGSIAAAALIFFTMGSLVPDTAVAKSMGVKTVWSSGIQTWLGTFHATLSVFVSALSFGVLFLMLWLLTAVAVIAYKRRISMPALLANSLFPITFFLAALRGQAVQGIRYFSWTLLFPILWNSLELRWSTSRPRHSIAISMRLAAYGLAVLFVSLMPIESKLLYKEFRARELGMQEFRAQHLERLSPMKLVANDIGYIGYFTGSPVCDMDGLVNGRARARLSTGERLRLCAAEHPQYAFLGRSGIGTLSGSLDLNHWSVCSVYDFANLEATDPHYLIAAPAVAPEVCAAAGTAPSPWSRCCIHVEHHNSFATPLRQAFWRRPNLARLSYPPQLIAPQATSRPR